jgi:hypothetical protein
VLLKLLIYTQLYYLEIFNASDLQGIVIFRWVDGEGGESGGRGETEGQRAMSKDGLFDDYIVCDDFFHSSIS